MEEYDICTVRQRLDGFSGVWQRVTGAPPASLRSQDDSLPELILAELRASQWDAALARMFQGAQRAVLLRHAAEAKRRARRLQAEYFILEGKTAVPAQRPCLEGTRLEALRTAYRRDVESAAKYADAAGSEQSEALRTLFDEYKLPLERSAREKRTMILSCF